MIEAVDMAASGIEIESGRSFFGKLSAPPEFPGALSEFFFFGLAGVTRFFLVFETY